ncbi:MAG: AAA family ATPase [Panacagrimonas sp.]
MSEQRDLALLLKSRFPLVVIETHEEARAVTLLERITNQEQWPFHTWSIAEGLQRVLPREVVHDTHELTAALRAIDQSLAMGIYALCDAHPFLEEPLNQRLIKEIGRDYHKVARTLVFVGPRVELPRDLQRMSARFELALATPEAIQNLLREESQLWRAEGGGELRGDADSVRMLVQHLAGIPLEDARRLIRQAIRDDGLLNQADVARVLKIKHEALGSAGVLSLELDTGRFDNVGGQGALKRWLQLRREIFLQPEKAKGLDVPKGILLLGVQGAGKSLAAKAIAGSWALPLLRLDFGALYNKFHGETERNLRESLKAADAMAPCVLWIDEIEKGLAPEGGGDGGLSRRVLGTLLTWMSERKSRVFLAATANDISSLPPELLRKGRFDEIFFVDLPDEATRRDIFAIHLRARELKPEAFEVGALAQAAAGYSGAEIEQAIVGALYEARSRDEALGSAHVGAELARSKPLSVVMGEQVQALRAWASSRTVPAN